MDAADIRTSRPLLCVNDLSVALQRPGKSIPILHNISFELRAGETLALIGASGSGKSMTALALLDLLPKPLERTGGEIRFAGRQISGVSAGNLADLRGCDIAMIFQDPGAALNPVFRVGGQIVDVIKTHMKLPTRAAKARTFYLLRQMGFADRDSVYHSYPHELSGGMAQRVMIAMALSCNPRLIIADEPTTALDVTTQGKILKLILDLQRAKKFALLLISHDLSLVGSLADFVAVLQSGRVVESGAAARIMASPKHPHTRELVDSVLHLSTTFPHEIDA